MSEAGLTLANTEETPGPARQTGAIITITTSARIAFHASTVVALRAGFWRVVHPSGRVVGYIEEIPTSEGRRYAARRLVINTTRLADLGEFWSVDDARQCFV